MTLPDGWTREESIPTEYTDGETSIWYADLSEEIAVFCDDDASAVFPYQVALEILDSNGLNETANQLRLQSEKHNSLLVKAVGLLSGDSLGEYMGYVRELSPDYCEQSNEQDEQP
jgi:hypothetical protein